MENRVGRERNWGLGHDVFIVGVRVGAWPFDGCSGYAAQLWRGRSCTRRDEGGRETGTITGAFSRIPGTL